jgi:hypothetical protein
MRASNNRSVTDWQEQNQKRMDKVFAGFVQKVLGYGSREKCLITSDGPDTFSFTFARALFAVMSRISSHTNWIIAPYRDLDTPMEQTVLDAINSGVDVIIQTNATGIGNALLVRKRPYRLNGQVYSNPLYYLKAARRIRAFWFMVNTPDDFLRCMDIDYERLGRSSREENAQGEGGGDLQHERHQAASGASR